MRQEKNHVIHIEFAHFSRLDLFELIEKYAIRQADSLGMNE
jgi:ADP-dependent phosphofructokinase/glucokinase